MIIRTSQFEDISGFFDKDERLAIVQREKPDSGDFFDGLIAHDMEVRGVIRSDSAEEDIQALLVQSLSASAIEHHFYYDWVVDMAKLCQLLGGLLNSTHVSLWLGTNRGCRRYHADNVPMRLVVTYAGRGTEWLPEEAIDRAAYEAGAPNEKILIDQAARQWLNEGDVGIFKGGKEGVLHRTPDDALTQRTLLLRIDHADYLGGANREYSVEQLKA